MITRLSPASYVEHLRSDAARLLDVAATRLDAPVPSCPGWSVADLVGHTAKVYAHKVACMRLNRRPDEGEWLHEAPDGDAVAWFGSSLDVLVEELLDRGPDAPSYTWYPPEQTVGFWHRRMAQETAVHRVDAELAAGAVTPVGTALAVDGVDELLVVFLGGDWSDEPIESASGRSIGVSTGEHRWSVTLERTAVHVSDDDGTADAQVSGEPDDLLLWLWGGRVADDVVTLSGDAGLVAELRARLDLVTT